MIILKLEDSWGFQISKIAQEMGSQFSKKLTKYDIGSREYGILLTIHQYALLTQLKIGELNKVDRTTIGQLVDLLERKDFVARQKNPKDRRQNLLVLTKTGRSLVEEMWQEMKEIEKDVLKHLSAKQKETLLTMVKAIRKGELN